ncbi:MAG: HAD family hydrolase [Candidatus Aureabacteria bacterium]|nr:HAD family hydrolase [Candidatus Auribacterota bacterium]
MQEQKKKKVLIFDLDNTLYNDSKIQSAYEKIANDLVWNRWWNSKILKKHLFSLPLFCFIKKNYIHLVRKYFQKKLNYAPPLSYVIKEFDIDFKMWKNARNNISDDFLPKRNTMLENLMKKLNGEYDFALITDNVPELTHRILESIGIWHFFEERIVYADGQNIKPDKIMWYSLLKKIKVDEPEFCLMVGDRYDIDLMPAAEMGMKVVQVEGVEDVYRLLRGLLRKDTGINKRLSSIKSFLTEERKLSVLHLEHTFNLRDKYVAAYLAVIIPILGIIVYTVQSSKDLPLLIFLVLLGFIMGCVIISFLAISWQARDYYREKREMINRFLAYYPENDFVAEIFLNHYINFTRDKVKRLPSAISTYSIFISWISIMNALLVSGALYMCSKEYDWSKEFTFYVISLASFLAIFVSWGLFKLWRFLLTSKKYLE